MTARDRLLAADNLADTRYGRGAVVLIPTMTECAACGYDALHDSGFDPSCATCAGMGQTATFVEYRMDAHIRIVDQNLIAYGATPPGTMLGDAIVSFSPRDHTMVLECMNNKDAYILIDGSRMRPVGINTAGIGFKEEYLANLRSFQPQYTAAGY